ncbi:MAG TPA: 3D domain-containing protein [Coriobacteriia bacterium]|nr:3D domain-containing protein [Coriobacteriia bacterium]
MDARPTWPTRRSKTQYLIAAFVPAAIVVFSITGFVWAQKDVRLVVDGKSRTTQTQASNVAELLADAGVSVGAADVVAPATSAKVLSGMTVVVRHSVPVTLQLGRRRVPLRVIGANVSDALVAAGLDPADNTGVQPPLDAQLRPGMTVTVPDAFLRIVRQNASISPAVHKTNDPTLKQGAKQVVSPGEPGRVVRVFSVMVANGVETTPVLTAESVVEKPKDAVVAVGTGSRNWVKPSGPGASRRQLRVETTGYSSQQSDINDITATGAKAVKGVIAVDPDVIPLGTHVYVPGYGYAVAADTGGAIDGRRIDLCFRTVSECMRWGRRSVTITILD